MVAPVSCPYSTKLVDVLKLSVCALNPVAPAPHPRFEPSWTEADMQLLEVAMDQAEVIQLPSNRGAAVWLDIGMIVNRTAMSCMDKAIETTLDVQAVARRELTHIPCVNT